MLEKVSPSSISAGRILSSLTPGIDSDPSSRYKVVVGPRNENTTGKLVGSSSPGLGNHRQHRIFSSSFFFCFTPPPSQSATPSSTSRQRSRDALVLVLSSALLSTKNETFVGTRLFVTFMCACSVLALLLLSPPLSSPTRLLPPYNFPLLHAFFRSFAATFSIILVHLVNFSLSLLHLASSPPASSSAA